MLARSLQRVPAVKVVNPLSPACGGEGMGEGLHPARLNLQAKTAS